MSKLIIDIGNSNIVIGIKEKNEWKHIWRIPTIKKAPKFHFALKISNLLFEAGIDINQIDYKIISSVVPELNIKFRTLLKRLNSKKLIELNEKTYPYLNISIPNPQEIGADLVANALAAHNIYKDNIIIVDFGTALTFTIIDKNGEILGVNIAPGIKTAINVLAEKTSQLDLVPLKIPENPIGHNTETAIQNGVLRGYIGLVNHMIKSIKKQTDENFKVVATGGLADVLTPHISEINIVNNNLTLEGLALLPELINKSNT
jgi:type III pantothenate kinase